MNPRMPPLPEPVGFRVNLAEGETWNGDSTPPHWALHLVGYGWEERFCGRTIEHLHTADQLLSAQRAAWNAAIEAAVQAVRDDLYPKNERSDWTDFAHDRACTSDALASAIRSLKEPDHE